MLSHSPPATKYDPIVTKTFDDYAKQSNILSYREKVSTGFTTATRFFEPK